jgi:hypothetical protein
MAKTMSSLSLLLKETFVQTQSNKGIENPQQRFVGKRNPIQLLNKNN